MAPLFGVGCASKRDQIAQALAGGMPSPAIREVTVAEAYRVGYPDVLEIAADGVTDATGSFPLNVDGRIEIARLGNPRVDGMTLEAMRRHLAQELGIAVEKVRCQVAAHRSRSIYIRGPIDGGDRAVPYRGPESIVDFIRRCGGLLPSANVKDIHVVRSNVPLGTRPQVFAVDLEAILLRGDPRTNVLLQSFDEIYIGELPRAKLGRALPDWLRPIYRGFCTVLPDLCPHDWRQQIGDPSPRVEPDVSDQASSRFSQKSN